MQSQILTALAFGVELFHGLGENIHIVGVVLFSCPVKFVLPLHNSPPHGMIRIRVSVVNLICKNIVLILVRDPKIKAEF